MASQHGNQLHLDYTYQPRHRFGWDKPPHPEIHALLSRGRDKYGNIVQTILNYKEAFCRIPQFEGNRKQATDPHWHQPWFPCLDGAGLYTFMADDPPKCYVEIGSGISTKFAAKAIRDYRLGAKILSIDPHPVIEINAICDDTIRKPLEEVDASVFTSLGNGDILLFDGTHRAFANSDVTVFFLEILPRLKRGVRVAIHDICLPFDYPPDWSGRYYNELYLMAAFLLGGATGFSILFPSFFVDMDEHLSQQLAPFYSDPRMIGRIPENKGGLFWMVKS